MWLSQITIRSLVGSVVTLSGLVAAAPSIGVDGDKKTKENDIAAFRTEAAAWATSLCGTLFGKHKVNRGKAAAYVPEAKDFLSNWHALWEPLVGDQKSVVPRKHARMDPDGLEKLCKRWGHKTPYDPFAGAALEYAATRKAPKGRGKEKATSD